MSIWLLSVEILTWPVFLTNSLPPPPPLSLSLSLFSSQVPRVNTTPQSTPSLTHSLNLFCPGSSEPLRRVGTRLRTCLHADILQGRPYGERTSDVCVGVRSLLSVCVCVCACVRARRRRLSRHCSRVVVFWYLFFFSLNFFVCWLSTKQEVADRVVEEVKPAVERLVVSA